MMESGNAFRRQAGALVLWDVLRDMAGVEIKLIATESSDLLLRGCTRDSPTNVGLFYGER